MWPSPSSPPPLEYLPPPPPTLSLRVQFLPKCQTRHTGNNRFPQRIHHCSHCIHHCIYDYYLDHRRSHYNDYLDHLYHTVTTSSRDKCSMKPNNINNLGTIINVWVNFVFDSLTISQALKISRFDFELMNKEIAIINQSLMMAWIISLFINQESDLDVFVAWLMVSL